MYHRLLGLGGYGVYALTCCCLSNKGGGNNTTAIQCYAAD